MSRVFVTGATGFLGGHVVRLLVADGAHVVALHRDPAAAQPLRALGAEPWHGDLDDVDALAAALRTPTDAVFHIAADTSMWRGHRERQARVNVEGTRHVLAAAVAARVRRFVHTSSIAVYGRVEHTALVESLPRAGLESWIAYERTKALAEGLVLQAAARAEIDAVVLNPAHVFGPGDRHNWARLILMIDQNRLPGAPPGSGAFADVREVARAHVTAWRRGRGGENYLLGGQNASFLELIGLVAAQLGRRAPARAVPEWVLRVYARVLDAAARLTGREPELTPEAVSMTSQKLRVDCGKAVAELDYRITPLPNLVEDTVTWLRAEGMLAPR